MCFWKNFAADADYLDCIVIIKTGLKSLNEIRNVAPQHLCVHQAKADCWGSEVRSCHLRIKDIHRFFKHHKHPSEHMH